MLLRSCEQLKALKDAGHTDLRVSVNLSLQEFSRPDVASRIGATLLKTGVQPADLDLEITERLLSRDSVRDYETCKQLKALGVGIVIDDYGIGSCSLGNLAHAPIDGIKVDNTLVAQLETSGS